MRETALISADSLILGLSRMLAQALFDPRPILSLLPRGEAATSAAPEQAVLPLLAERTDGQPL